MSMKDYRISQALIFGVCLLWTFLISIGSYIGIQEYSNWFMLFPLVIGVILVVLIEVEERIY